MKRSTPTTGILLAVLLAITLTAFAATRMNGLQIGPNPSTTNIDLQADGDIVATGSITASSFIGAGSGSTFSDSVFRVQDNGDATKQVAIEASAISTGTTRTITMPNANVNLGDIATNNAKVSNATHTGDVTGSGLLTIAAGAVDPAMLSATGTADNTTFLRGDNTWNTPAGGGDVTMAGVQTITGAKSFNDAKLILNGSTSGTTTLKANATAGTTTATLQAATGILAYTADIPADTDSLTEGATNRYVSTGDETKLGHITVTQAVNLDTMETDIAGFTGAITALTGDVTASGTGSVAATIAAGAVDIPMLSATGTPSGSNYLRGDGTWAAPSGTGDALVANPLSQFAATTSSQLLGVLSDETGTGAAVFGTSPTLTTPALGTPSALVLTNATGLPVAGGGTGAATLGDAGVLIGNGTGAVQVTSAGTAGQVLMSNGTGVDPTFQTASGTGDALVANPLSQFAATTSAQLAGVISDETGTGAAVFGTSPTFTTPALGTPSALVLTNATGLPATAVGNGLTDAQVSDTLTASLFTGSGSSTTAVDLATAEVAGDLPLANVALVAQNTIAGRAIAAGTGDITALTPLQVRTILQTPSAVTSTTNSTAWNSDNSQIFSHTLSENTTIAASSGTPFDGQVIVFHVTQAAGIYTLAWNAAFVAGDTFTATIPAVGLTSGDVSSYIFTWFPSPVAKWVLLGHSEY
jgi:hypothetical protein